MSVSSRLSWLARATSSAAIAILLAGCDERSKMWTESEIADIAADAAADVATDTGSVDHEDRIAELERENRELRSDIDSQELMIDALHSDLQTFMDQYNSHTH